jgi:LmbE family N-acetylglucosaminyl deacetylase
MVDEADMKGFATIADLRVSELRCAAGVLGLSGVYYLDYRDSGMPGSVDNQNPDALINHSLDEVAGKVVRLIRELKPQVVITFDPIGGYRHPDHIHIQQATVKAFSAAGDPQQYPDPDGPPAFQPQKLYFQTIGRGFLRLMVRILPIFGKDPRRWGRNGDIDLTSLAVEDFPTHAEVDFTPVAAIRAEAAACHASQGGVGMSRGIQGWILNRFRKKESYMRAFPDPKPGERIEKDLFVGVFQG